MKLQTALGQFGSVGDLALELRKALTAIVAGWNVEHAPDGTHAFPARQWTPILGGDGGVSTGQVYTVQVGRSLKAGALVTAFYTVRLSTKGTIPGNLQIQGLPYVVSGALGAQIYGTGRVVRWFDLATAMVSMTHQCVGNTTAAYLIGGAVAQTSNGTITTADLTNLSSLVGSITYLTED